MILFLPSEISLVVLHFSPEPIVLPVLGKHSTMELHPSLTFSQHVIVIVVTVLTEVTEKSACIQEMFKI